MDPYLRPQGNGNKTVALLEPSMLTFAWIPWMAGGGRDHADVPATSATRRFGSLGRARMRQLPRDRAPGKIIRCVHAC
ncbi:hypothetical protein Jiend_57980 [Micromonospora endophytica]|nr:hypothetical protein Jiend_57980 [Micromonospora endophytica]